jgi:hypothetical protein
VNAGPDFLRAGQNTSRDRSVSDVWELFVANVGAPDWRVGELIVRATASAIARQINVVTDDESMSYRFTYFPSGPSAGAVNVGYVDRVHYVPLLNIAAAASASASSVSAPLPRPPVWDSQRLEARRLELRAQLRSLRTSAPPCLQQRDREGGRDGEGEPEPPPKRRHVDNG